MSLKQILYFGAHRAIGSSLGSVYRRVLKTDAGAGPGHSVPRALADILSHCQRSVPYYADLFSGIGHSYLQDPIAYLKHVPILTKDLIRTNFSRLTSNDIARRRWIYNTSGGSTGEPIKLIQDRAYLDYQSAVQMLSFTWAGRSFSESALRIWGSERDILQGSVGLKMRFLNWLTNDAYVNAFRMTPAVMRSAIELLNSKRPRLIIAYTNAINELARFADREGILVQPQSAVMTSAGTLYPFIRNKIETVFGCRVFDRYGSREVGDIACECREHAGLHVFGFTNYVEIVDDDSQLVPNGVEGNIVVTCLTNYAMPLIRYAIGDRGVMSPGTSCSCGRNGQILQRILGRSVDAFRTLDGTLVDGEYFTHLLYFRDWVRKFQVIQTGRTAVTFRIAKTELQYRPAELEQIIAAAQSVMGANCKVDFEFVDDIPQSPSGKYRYTISQVQP